MKIFSILVLLTAAFLQNAPDKSSIEGKVVIDGTAGPIEGATVTIRSTDSNPGAASQRMTTSSQDGSFTFADLTPGSYIVEVSKETYLAPSPNSNPLVNSRSLILQPREARRNIEVPLVHGASISGQVKDSAGNHVTHAEVTVYQLVYSLDGYPRLLALSSRAPSPIKIPEVQETNDRGEFRIYGLPSGTYYANARPRLPDGPGPVTFFPGSRDASQSTVIVAGPGADVPNINITLQSAPPFKVSGTISVLPLPAPDFAELAKSQDPLQDVIQRAKITSGYLLHLIPKDPAQLTEVYPRQYPGRTFAAKGGPFSISGVAPGDYNLVVRNVGGRSEIVQIRVLDSDITNVAVTIPLPFDVAGKIDISAAGGTTFDVTKIGLSLEPEYQIAVASTLSTASRIEKTGTFKFSGVSPGRYRPVFKSLPANMYVSSFRYDGHNILQDGVLNIENDNIPIEIELNSNAASIRGMVLDPVSRRPAAALVTVIPQGTPYSTNLLPDVRIFTDTDGNFQIGSLAPGDYKIYAWENIPTNAELNATFIAQVASRFTAVRISPNSNMEVQLNRVPKEVTTH